MEEKLKEMSSTFWRNIFDRKWHDCSGFKMDKPCYWKDREEIETTFEICQLMAYHLCGHNSCFCLKYNHLPFDSESLDWLCIGWGDPKVTSDYGYCYFDFSNDLVYIDGGNIKEEVITIGEAFRKIYV